MRARRLVTLRVHEHCREVQTGNSCTVLVAGLFTDGNISAEKVDRLAELAASALQNAEVAEHLRTKRRRQWEIDQLLEERDGLIVLTPLSKNSSARDHRLRELCVSSVLTKLLRCGDQRLFGLLKVPLVGGTVSNQQEKLRLKRGTPACAHLLKGCERELTRLARPSGPSQVERTILQRDLLGVGRARTG